MAKSSKQGMGEVGPKEVISPLSYQRTDEGTDSLQEYCPQPSGPKDPAGFIPKCVGEDK